MKTNKVKPNSINQLLVISIASMAFISCLFFELFFGISTWGKEVKSQMKVYVYLEDSVSYQQIQQHILTLKKSSYVGRTADNKIDIQFISKNKIAADFQKKSNESYEDLLGENNPFKNLIIVGLKEEFKNSDGFKRISKLIENTPGVFEVTYPSLYVSLLIVKIKQISLFLIVLILILAALIYVQMSNYVKLNIHSNRLLIKSMQLLGSTNDFIRKPYLVNALLHGLYGGAIGFTLSISLVYYFSNAVDELSVLFLSSQLQILSFFGCLLFCMLFSLFSTYLSLNKYLKIRHSNLF
jgi:cell division transport system permease protein